MSSDKSAGSSGREEQLDPQMTPPTQPRRACASCPRSTHRDPHEEGLFEKPNISIAVEEEKTTDYIQL